MLNQGVPIETSNQGTPGAAVFIQDQTTEDVDLYLHQVLNSITLAANTIVDSRTIDLVAGHNVVAGNGIMLSQEADFSQFIVLSVATDTITLDSPVDKVYKTQATCTRNTIDMRVDGSSTAEVFQIAPISGQVWDVTRIILVMESTSNQMDFTGFGSLSALTNGCVLRREDGNRKNLFNWKSNGDFINRSFDNVFQAKTGGGGSGFTARATYGGQSKRGVTIRLSGENGEALQVVIQDAITAAGTLTRFNVIAQGHVVQ